MPVTSSQIFNNREMQQLVGIARQGITDHFLGITQTLCLDIFPQKMQDIGACFVTLEVDANLQGCLGCIIARRPLVEEVYSKAQSATYQDHRFPPVKEEQLERLTVEVSVLSSPQHFVVKSQQDLEEYLATHPVGVILSDEQHSAVFLPQVWEQLPVPHTFIQHLKIKGGWPNSYWSENIQVQLFSVQNRKERFISPN